MKSEELIKLFENIETQISLDGGYEFEKLQRKDSIQCCEVLLNVLIKEIESIEFNYDLNLSAELEYWNKIKKEID
jgi:hypothetical protein